MFIKILIALLGLISIPVVLVIELAKGISRLIFRFIKAFKSELKDMFNACYYDGADIVNYWRRLIKRKKT